MVAACALRFFQFPTFWLDEAFVAVSLRDPDHHVIFGRLEYGQHFPRVYLAMIDALRQLFGYQVWVLRLLPSLSFVLGTALWARLLAKRSGHFAPLALLSGALLLGSSFWLEQAIEFKQYTLEVVVALIPFLVGDELFDRALGEGRDKKYVALLAVACVVSYSYPIALGARVLGWYLWSARRRGWSLNPAGACALAIPVGVGLALIWMTDYRFNLIDHKLYLEYWNNCILTSRFKEGVGSGLKLIGEFIWGWHHGRFMPVVVAVVAPLEALGVYRVVGRLKNIKADSTDSSWGSRSVGSLIILPATILASAVVSYPMCSGRLALFTQVHTQLLTLEGALFILSSRRWRKAGVAFLAAATVVVSLYSAQRYFQFIRTEPIENLRPVVSLIDPAIANTVWVHPCSVAQVGSLPGALPVEKVLLDTRRQKNFPRPGEKAWIVWTNLSEDYCDERLSEIRSRAVNWQTIHEGPGRGLALAEF